MNKDSLKAVVTAAATGFGLASFRHPHKLKKSKDWAGTIEFKGRFV